MSKYSLIPTEKEGKHFLYKNHQLYNKFKERDIYDHEDVKNAEVTMLVARNSAKEKIRASKGPVQKVFEKTINKAIAESELGLKDASKFAPKYKNISKTLYKIKNKDQVSKDKLPNQIEDINFERDLNEYTMKNCKNRFLLHDDEQEERIICFASNIQLEILSKYQLKRNAIVHGFVCQPEVIVMDLKPQQFKHLKIKLKNNYYLYGNKSMSNIIRLSMVFILFEYEDYFIKLVISFSMQESYEKLIEKSSTLREYGNDFNMIALSLLFLRPIRCYSIYPMSMYVDTSRLNKYPISLSLNEIHFTPIVPISKLFYIDAPTANQLNFIKYNIEELKYY
ncbi:unnamed protein product [Brachionus calyciflorus]|uniref:Uncharacterized protein n=1 Tax=Brachionus calyciflorus TaxID=104777 RepID=A0A814M964_9BILA|nr:unnamed protein product [Brachionus calyciflorus]